MKTKENYYFLINSLEGGGAERVATNIASNLVKQKKEVYMITLKTTTFYDLPHGVHHIALSNISNNFVMFLCIPRYVARFQKIMKKYRLADGMSLLEIANFVHILAKKNATISFRTHINVFTGVFGFLHKIIIKALYPKAGRIVVNSLENKFDLAYYLDIPEDKIEVLYNQLDHQDIISKSKEPVDKNIVNKIKGKKVFITTGRLIASKHHEKILHGLSHIYKNINADWIYLIVGDGPEAGKLKQLAKYYAIDRNVLFLGTQKNVFKYLNLADYFLYASAVEGFPNVLAEAKEMQIPIVTSDFKSGAKEVILGKYHQDMIGSMSYPYVGEYGMLLDLKKFEKQLFDRYKTIA